MWGVICAEWSGEACSQWPRLPGAWELQLEISSFLVLDDSVNDNGYDFVLLYLEEVKGAFFRRARYRLPAIQLQCRTSLKKGRFMFGCVIS